MALIEEPKVERPENLTAKEQLDLKNKKLVRKLLWLVVGSLLFAFALVPLYDVLCSLTGLNGKTQNSAALLTKAKVDNSRWVNVQFTSSVMPGLGWNFYPKQTSIRLHPGQIETVLFVAKNITNEVVVGQAVPSITPGIAAANLKKIECFCFVRQSLKPGEEKEMPLRFFVSPELPKDVSDMTLSYSFFPAVSESK
ncbi:cytochrome c oxidase assembly protein [Methylotenera sp.]|uniref:cytochrome c oxidase assembly protein n=1 Tax=Methylotenera sp. TaxID=2051956 RepID=UPI00248742E0|nr:cytochrome c oxidase assembly protein [Methylotenera sp.]MDI1298120.1 cytochrome c oxidase assembly protein [Methylotenera sp.]